MGRAGPLAGLRRERPRLLTSSIWAYRCSVGNLRRITGSAGSDDWFDGLGRGWTRTAAIIGAVAEALENYAACLAGAGSRLAFGSAAQLGTRAVGPERFVRLSPTERVECGLTAAPADAASRIAWYPGIRVADREPALLPAQVVLAGHNLHAIEAHVQFGGSKGLGAHWSDSAAILHGLCEVIEADAYMIAFLNRLPVPEIDLGTITDASITQVVESIERVDGEFLRAWNLTTDCGVPTVLAGLSGSLYGGPVITFGCATAPNPVEAVTKAVFEAIHSTAWFSPGSVAAARAWTAADIQQVRGRAGHKLLGANAEYRPSLDWLLAPRAKIAIEDLPDLSGPSVETVLADILGRASAAGLSCYGCDLTPPDVAASVGLRVWRVVVPEAQPFSLFPVRYFDSRRLREVPVKLGYRLDPPTEASFNRLPHPCP